MVEVLDHRRILQIFVHVDIRTRGHHVEDVFDLALGLAFLLESFGERVLNQEALFDEQTVLPDILLMKREPVAALRIRREILRVVGSRVILRRGGRPLTLQFGPLALQKLRLPLQVAGLMFDFLH